MVNPIEAKERAVSVDGKKMRDELEELNWRILDAMHTLDELQKQFDQKKAIYLHFLGYEFSDKEVKDGCSV